MSKNHTKSVSDLNNPKTKVRDATSEDVKVIRTCLKSSTLKFFGNQDMELEFRSSNYSLVVEHESGKLCAYANIGSSPNLSALPKNCWLDWMHFHFRLKNVTYGNILFLTFLVLDAPYNKDMLFKIFEEVFLREPKIKYICTVAPPIDSVYKDILAIHCRQIFSSDGSASRLSQSIFICEKYNIISKMRFRRALIEDNDDLVEIIDQTFKFLREELGQYYIAEQVMSNDPSETIVVAEISNNPIGMIWLNTRINHKTLVDNFEIAAYANFSEPYNWNTHKMQSRNVMDLIQNNSYEFFNKADDDRSIYQNKDLTNHRMSLNNLFIDASLSKSDSASNESEDKYPKSLFKEWNQISKRLKSPHTYTEEFEKHIGTPQSSDLMNAFAIRLFGLSSAIDPRRIYDLVAASFSAYSDKDYCLISLSSTEASSNSTSGPLLKYFSRLIPRAGSNYSDCFYVAHRNSFISEIELSALAYEDVADVEAVLHHPAFKGNQTYDVVNIMKSIEDSLTNPWSTFDVLIIRSRGFAIGFVVLRQNCMLCEFETNYVLEEDEELYPEWQSGKLKHLHLHPAFMWEWVHVTREIFRLTGYFSMYYKLRQESNQPILNSILLKMFPILPRKILYKAFEDPYALYFMTIKMCHMERVQIENKIVIGGFNETCKGFLETLLFSPKTRKIQCRSVTVIAERNGFIEAEHDLNYFKEQQSLFFQANDKFSAEFLRKLEYRTWVNFVEGELKEIDGDDKRITLQNGTILRYDRLFLMSTSRYGSPKTLQCVPPSNYIEVNSRLDKIVFYDKIQVFLAMDSISLPILIYGSAAMAHSCLSILIDLGIKPAQICLVMPANENINFPETFDDEYVTKWILTKEKELGVRTYQNISFVNWNLYPNEQSIESVLFESDCKETVSLKCLAFISFCVKESINLTMNGELNIINNKIIRENSKTNISFVYACGATTRTQLNDELLGRQFEQKYLNKSEVGSKLALSFVEEVKIGSETNMTEANFAKPIFRQYQLLDGCIYAGLRKPGRCFSRKIQKNLDAPGQDLVTRSESGDEYCRLYLDQNGFVSGITVITKKYKNLEILCRIFGLHETYFNNLRVRWKCGEIENLLDYLHQNTFSAILHDQFKLFRQTMRTKTLDCLIEFLGNTEKLNKLDALKFLKNKKMDLTIQNNLIAFIKKQSKFLHKHYALSNDFLV